MNNKKIGNEFENEACEILQKQGYWVHFITPDNRGAQPFDIIATKDNIPYAIDCKTCVSDTFNINRLEDNQVMAFEYWMKCGNNIPMIWVKHNGYVYILNYVVMKKIESVNLKKIKPNLKISDFIEEK